MVLPQGSHDLHRLNREKHGKIFLSETISLDIWYVASPLVGISGTTAKSRQRKFVPSSHPGPFAVVATSRKSQTKVGTLAWFDLL